MHAGHHRLPRCGVWKTACCSRTTLAMMIAYDTFRSVLSGTASSRFQEREKYKLACMRMFLNLGKSRQRSSKRMFLSQTSRSRIHACARSLSVIVADRLHSALPIRPGDLHANARLGCDSLRGWGILISEGSLKERQQQLKISLPPSVLTSNLAHFT